MKKIVTITSEFVKDKYEHHSAKIAVPSAEIDEYLAKKRQHEPPAAASSSSSSSSSSALLSLSESFFWPSVEPEPLYCKLNALNASDPKSEGGPAVYYRVYRNASLKSNHLGLDSHQMLANHKEVKFELLSQFQLLSEVARAGSVKVEPPFETVPNTYSHSVFHKGQILKVADSDLEHRVVDIKDVLGRSVNCAYFTFVDCTYNKNTKRDNTNKGDNKKTDSKTPQEKNNRAKRRGKAQILKRLFRIQTEVDHIMELLERDDEENDDGADEEEDDDESEEEDDDEDDGDSERD